MRRFDRSPKVAVLGLVLALVLAGCTPKSVVVLPPHRLTIGLSMDSLVVERWLRDRDVFLARAKELGAEVLLQVAGEDAEVQNRQVLWLLSQKVDALVVIPNDTVKIREAIRAAHDAGVPVLDYDRLADKAGADAFLSFDNFKIGQLIASSLVQVRAKAHVLIIDGSRKDHNALLYQQGIHQILNPLVARGDYRIDGEAWLEDWSNEEATKAVQSLLGDSLSSTGPPDAVLCANDFLAEAVINVLAVHRLSGKVLVVGHDAELSACQRVVEGTQLATVYKPIPLLAALAAQTAVRMAQHQPLGLVATVDDGLHSVPALLLDAVAVTAANMDSTVIRDGFHTREDVYRHVPMAQRPGQHEKLSTSSTK